MLRSKEWQEWLDGKVKFLWIYGIPGAGKTVLASFLVEQAQACCLQRANVLIADQQKPMVCVYYYCYFARNQDEAAPFLRWLVSQLCRQARLIPSEIDRLFQLKHVPSISQLLNALQLVLGEFGTVCVIIDAVDESQSRQDLLKILRDLVTDHRFDKVRLLATSREYFDIELCFSDISSQISMRNPVVEDDIRRYAHSALVSNRRFQSWPQSLVVEAENALAKGAKGM
jgi:Cdc6-like AAA superfamily ATPase